MPSLTLPDVVIAISDHLRLEGLVAQAAAEKHPVAGFLLTELRRAAVVTQNELPAGTVTLNRWVGYRCDWGWPVESRVLVCPQDYQSGDTHLSVLSPLGAALIGLRVGNRIPYRSIEGVRHVASVESLDPPLRFAA